MICNDVSQISNTQMSLPIESMDSSYYGNIGCNNINCYAEICNEVIPNNAHMVCQDISTLVDSKLNVSATTFIPNTSDIDDNENDIALPTKGLSLNDLRSKCPNQIILAHININSIRNKFDMLCEFIQRNLDILLVSETKIDESFPSAQFKIPGFATPFRYDKSSNSGGLLLYVRKDIPSKLIKFENSNDNIQLLFTEINLFKKTWLIGCSYNPHKSMISSHLTVLSLCLDKFTQQYENIILMGDYNCDPNHTEMADFCEVYGLKNLVKEPTCFKSMEKPTLIDLILTNKPKSFQRTINVESGLSDFHKMTVTVMKCEYKKHPPKVIFYRDFKHFSNDLLRYDLEGVLPICDMQPNSCDEFINTFMNVFDKHAPLKKKYVRGNNGPFITRDIRKAIMTRSKLANKYHKEKSMKTKLQYNKQRNVCTYLVRKAKREYYKNLKPSSITDTKSFWKTVKPFLSDKVNSTENITLFEENVISSDDETNAKIFSNFFANAVKNLNIELKTDIIDINVIEEDQISTAIKMFENHPSINKIKEITTSEFSFKQVSPSQVHNQIIALNLSKACPKGSIPPKIIKENHDIFTTKIHFYINYSITSGEFPSLLKLADITPAHKKDDRCYKSNYRPVSLLPAMSKIFERILYNQINEYIDSKLSKYLCGFRAGFSTQYCLIVMIENGERLLINKVILEYF